MGVTVPRTWPAFEVVVPSATAWAGIHPIVPGPAHEDVVSGVAPQVVGATPALDDVIADASDDPVVAVATESLSFPMPYSYNLWFPGPP